MSEKNIKSRIINKHDTEENWLKAVNFIPKQGEIIIYDRDNTYNYERLKIGDGITNVNSLPFIQSSGQSSGQIEAVVRYDIAQNLTEEQKSQARSNIGVTSPDTSTFETVENKVTEINSESTDTEYPSAKAVYDYISNGNSSGDSTGDGGSSITIKTWTEG